MTDKRVKRGKVNDKYARRCLMRLTASPQFRRNSGIQNYRVARPEGHKLTSALEIVLPCCRRLRQQEFTRIIVYVAFVVDDCA